MNTRDQTYVVGDRVRYRGSSVGTQQREGDRIGVVQAIARKPVATSRLQAATAQVAWSERTDDWNHVLPSELVGADSDD